MNNKQFIEDCKRRTPTARINTGTGKMLNEALARIAELEAELAPSITFKPWVPERVTLADRPDEVLTCICPKMPMLYRVVAINKSGVVHFLDAMNRPSDTVLAYRDPADYVVVDLDAAQTKTLAD